MTPEGKALKEQYQWEPQAQWKGTPLEGDIAVAITLYFGTKRRADLDNSTSSVWTRSRASRTWTTAR